MTPRRRTRTLCLAIGVTAAAALAASPAAGAKAKGFEYGVTAAEVNTDSAILWAKTKKPGTTYVQLVHDFRFQACDEEHSYAKVMAKKSNDNTVQKRVKDLPAGTNFKYRWCTPDGGTSETGKFATAPDPKRKETIRFAISGDQDARPVPGGTEPYWNGFEVWNAIRSQKNDFNVLMGDTIYSDTEVPGYGVDDVALTVAQKWAAYKTNLAMKPWSRARGSSAYYAHWDDHEFINDFSPAEDTFPLGAGTVNIDGEELYRRGVNAFTDYNPVTYSRKTGIYRSVQWGKNLELFFLDERSFRSPGADYQGACDNPAGSGNPDLAPTAPQSTRSTFAPLIPQLAEPPPPGCVAAINDPSRTLLGSAQLKRFQKEIEKSDATFKVVLNEVPIQQFYALPYDRWEGYEAERQAVLRHLQQNVDNVVFLTTDVHANLVNDARLCTLEPGCPQDTGILDVTTGPIGTATFSQEIAGAIGDPQGGALIHGGFFKRQPPDGPGMRCAATDQYSYAQVEVDKTQLTIDLLDQNDQPVKDTGDRSTADTAPACAQIVIPKQ